jgi:hypothetical protein
MANKFSSSFSRIWAVLLLGVSLSCGYESSLEVNLQSGAPPQFTLSGGKALGSFFVYRIPEGLADEPVPTDKMTKESPDMTWLIEGRRSEEGPITYGAVPKGMQEVIPAKPLQEGEHYLVFGTSLSQGGFKGLRFVINDGNAVRTQ